MSVIPTWSAKDHELFCSDKATMLPSSDIQGFKLIFLLRDPRVPFSLWFTSCFPCSPNLMMLFISLFLVLILTFSFPSVFFFNFLDLLKSVRPTKFLSDFLKFLILSFDSSTDVSFFNWLSKTTAFTTNDWLILSLLSLLLFPFFFFFLLSLSDVAAVISFALSMRTELFFLLGLLIFELDFLLLSWPLPFEAPAFLALPFLKSLLVMVSSPKISPELDFSLVLFSLFVISVEHFSFPFFFWVLSWYSIWDFICSL